MQAFESVLQGSRAFLLTMYEQGLRENSISISYVFIAPPSEKQGLARSAELIFRTKVNTGSFGANSLEDSCHTYLFLNNGLKLIIVIIFNMLVIFFHFIIKCIQLLRINFGK